MATLHITARGNSSTQQLWIAVDDIDVQIVNGSSNPDPVVPDGELCILTYWFTGKGAAVDIAVTQNQTKLASRHDSVGAGQDKGAGTMRFATLKGISS